MRHESGRGRSGVLRSRRDSNEPPDGCQTIFVWSLDSARSLREVAARQALDFAVSSNRCREGL